MSRDLTGAEPSPVAEVIPLGSMATEAPPEDPGSPPRTLHGIAITGTAACAVGAIASFVTLITVRWPGQSGRLVTATMMGFAVGFLAFLSATIFTAARDTYVRRAPSDERQSE